MKKHKIKKLKAKIDLLERRLQSAEHFRENMYSNIRFLDGQIAALQFVMRELCQQSK